MEILIQSVLQQAKRLGSAVHIRYSGRKDQPVGNSGNGKEGGQSEKSEEPSKKTSYVIIHKPYSYLEPVVRSMFDEAEDVKVIVDRRVHERRQGSTPVGIANRRTPHERRQVFPMLDILITVEP